MKIVGFFEDGGENDLELIHQCKALREGIGLPWERLEEVKTID